MDSKKRTGLIFKRAYTEDLENGLCEYVDPESEFGDMLKEIEIDSDIDIVENNDK